MLDILLQQIRDFISKWFTDFTTHAQHVENKLDSIDQTASDIKTDADNLPDIKDNTAAVITPINNIKTNTDSIVTSSGTTATNTTAIMNQMSTVSTNTGRAAAYAEDCANNTLNILDKVTTIASDTTQIRADNVNIAADVSSINQAISYYVANTLVTEDSEGQICNIDTDLEDYLQKLKVNIPADPLGYTGITITKLGKNICPALTKVDTNGLTTTISADGTIHVSGTATGNGGYITTSVNFPFTMKSGTRLTLSVSNVLNTNLRMLFNTGTADISSGQTYRTVTLSNDITSGRLYLFTTANQAYDLTFKFQIELGSSATEYESYKVMTYPVSFGSTITDGAEADLLSGLVKVNTTPVSFIQISPIAVRTYKGVNNIYSDIGTSALTYRETLKNYLAKNNQ